jgi:hypothetical protein
MLLDADGRDALAATLADVPEHVFALHALTTGSGRAWTLGSPDHPDAALVESVILPGELFGFGDPGALWSLLRDVKGWKCVLVERDLAPVLRQHIEHGLGVPTRSFEDVGYVLRTPPPEVTLPSVRVLGPQHEAIVATLPRDWYANNEDLLHRALTEGLHADQSGDEFDRLLDASIQSIYEASVAYAGRPA